MVSNMESLTAGPPPAAAAGEPSAARKKVTGSMDAARNIQCGHYCNNDQSGRDRVEIQRQCGKAPTILKGGMRRRFSGQGEESLVRMIAAKCRDRMSCDIGVNKDGKRVKGKVQSLCDTGAQAGVCGTAFAKK